MPLPKPYAPQPVDEVTLAFPANVEPLMPAWEDIPDEVNRILDKISREGLQSLSDDEKRTLAQASQS